MNSHFRSRFAHLIFFCFCLQIVTGVQDCFATWSKSQDDFKSALQERIQNQSYTLRQQPNHSGFLYVHVNTNDYLCKIEPGSLFPLPADLENVTISKITTTSETEILFKRATAVRPQDNKTTSHDITVESDLWKFTLKHPSLGKNAVLITKTNGDLPDNIDEVIAVLGYVLKGGDLPNPTMYVGSQSSKMLHYVGSGHVPTSTDLQYFSTKEEALSVGYKLCPLCFNSLIRLPYLKTEMAMGKETEASIRHYYQLDQTPEVQARVFRIGQKVLAHWPTKLKGYDYRFSVIDNQDFNAVACPGGYIFVSRGLVEGTDNDDELEAVMAHEIAHVELRHGLMEYLEAQRGARDAVIFASIVTLGVGAAGAAAGYQNSVNVASASGTISFLLANLCAQLAQIGYSKEHNEEADIYALIYLQSQGKSKEPLLSVLKKIRTSKEVEISISGEKIDDPSLLDLKERLYAAETLHVQPFDQDGVYDAYDKNGDILYTLYLHAQATYEKRDGNQVLMILGEVSTTPAIGDSQEFDGLQILQGQQKVYLRTDGSVKIAPFDTLAVSFARNDNHVDFVQGEFIPTLDGVSVDRMAKRQ
jgi:Zn-dependent protease with chaperone function